MSKSLKTRSGRKPSQRADELLPFISLLHARQVTSYLEVGARHGDTFHEVMTNLPKGSKGVAVDMPGGPWGIQSSRGYLDAVAIDLRARGYDITVIYGDSTAPWVIERVRELGPFAAALIDGDHSLDGVMQDWMNFRDISEIVAFHDIDGRGQVQCTSGQAVEVPTLWDELKKKFDTVEFIGAERGMGIGVVFQ